MTERKGSATRAQLDVRAIREIERVFTDTRIALVNEYVDNTTRRVWRRCPDGGVTCAVEHGDFSDRRPWLVGLSHRGGRVLSINPDEEET